MLGDKKKIRQIVSSLVSNAVKFTPDHGAVAVAVQPGPLSPHEVATAARAIQLVVTRLRHRHLARAGREDLRAVLSGRFVVDARVRRHRPRPDAREGVRRGARRPDLGRHVAGPGLDVRRDVSAARVDDALRRSSHGLGEGAMTELSVAIPIAVLCVLRVGVLFGHRGRAVLAPPRRSRAARAQRGAPRSPDRRAARAAAPADRDGADRQRGVQRACSR